ncbi:lipase family protein [Rhodococcus sp. IEGM 1409]|uniref:lipase family protein n=1 Tax=Rhodococcus sp. IEGM 1409 TaxID=3047082 RepID=UPI0024B7178B|nr:lipase family protein [Rhodococcus sp. IEGM 1409]MDI9898523.1 lipase family protein [Rhodococcus sp. IEGM 1409]
MSIEPWDPEALPVVSDAALQDRGDLISSTELTDLDPLITDTQASAFRVVYQSTSGIDGLPVQVSGSVFRPAGPAPEGGWNIVSFGHAPAGLSAECGPSLYPNLLGFASAIASLMKLGMVAVMTDYQGLGISDRPHAYLEPNTAGFNVIDAVRAAKAVVPETTSKWAAYGVAQGGQAAWSAAELADSYGTGLDFVGSVALAPTVDLVQMAELSTTNWLTRDQQVIMPFLIAGLQSAYPEAKETDYLHGSLATNHAMWLACSGALADQRAKSNDKINPADTAPSTPEAAEIFKTWLTDVSLPKREASAPLLVINGGQDAVVRPMWVQHAVDVGCELGDTIQHIVRPEQTHYNLDAGGETALWLIQRFAGEPAPNDC